MRLRLYQKLLHKRIYLRNIPCNEKLTFPLDAVVSSIRLYSPALIWPTLWVSSSIGKLLLEDPLSSKLSNLNSPELCIRRSWWMRVLMDRLKEMILIMHFLSINYVFSKRNKVCQLCLFLSPMAAWRQSSQPHLTSCGIGKVAPLSSKSFKIS